MPVSNSSKSRFNGSRQKLTSALNNLEKIIEKKLKSNKNEVNFNNLLENFEEAELQIFSQNNQIQNLSTEINNLQKSLADVAKDNELLRSKNIGNIENKMRMNKQLNELVDSLEKKLKIIEEIISKS
ncbi:MAG: hypothetical protein ACKO6C_03635 [Alphaproteobacteria bacterium]